MLEGFEYTAKMIDTIQKSEKNCRDVIHGWNKIDTMAKTWREPTSFQFKSFENVIFNNVNISEYVTNLIKSYNSKMIYDLG